MTEQLKFHWGKEHPFAFRVPMEKLAECHRTRDSLTLLSEWITRAEDNPIDSFIVKYPNGKVYGGYRYGSSGIDIAYPKFDPEKLRELSKLYAPPVRPEGKRVFPFAGLKHGMKPDLKSMAIPVPCFVGQVIAEPGDKGEYALYFNGDGLGAREDAPLLRSTETAIALMEYLWCFANKKRSFFEEALPGCEHSGYENAAGAGGGKDVDDCGPQG